MHGQQHQGLLRDQQGHQAEAGDRHMDRQRVGQGPAQVGGDAAPQGHRRHQGADVVVEQHQIRRLPGHGGAVAPHGHADVGGLEGRGIVHAVAPHGHHLPRRLQGLHQLQLLLRLHPREHRHPLQLLLQGLRAEALEIGPTQHRPRRQSRLIGDGAGGDRAITAHHHHPHAGGPGLGNRLRHPRAQRVGQAHQADGFKGVVVHIRGHLRQLGRVEAGGHTQHPQPGLGQPIRRLHPLAGGLVGEVAQGGDRLRGPLGGDLRLPLAIAPELRKHEQVALQGVFPQQRPAGMQVIALVGGGQLLRRQALDRHLHGIHRIVAAGQHRQLHQPMPGLSEGFANAPEPLGRPRQQPLHRHAVFGEGAGFIHRQHRGAAQALHRRWPAGQHPQPRQPQRTQGQKQGQHHGDFIGQHRQRQGQGRQQGLRPLARGQAMQQQQAAAEQQCHQGEPRREPPRVPLQPRQRRLQGGQAAADLPQLRLLPHRLHLGPAAAAGHQ